MKKKFLMVISTITVITGLFILTTGSDKVRADESGDNSCETITNYYMFLDEVTPKWFSENWCTENPGAGSCDGGNHYDSSTGNYNLTTTKPFNLPVPETVKKEDREEGYIKVTQDTAGDFWDKYSKLSSQSPMTFGNENEFYIRSDTWGDSTGNINNNSSNLPEREKFVERVNPATKVKFVPTFGSDHIFAKITRTWSSADAQAIYNAGQNDPSFTISYSPYIYYIKYTTCDNKYKVNVKYLEKGTDKELADPEVVKSGLNDGDNYEFTCKDNISKYDLVTKDKQSGKINGKDAEAVCYYEKESYLLTINYGDDEECSNPLKSADTQSVKWGESVEVEPGNKIGSMTLTGLGTYSSQISPAPKYNNGVVTLTMPAKNASICVVYTPQTGSAIGKVMLLGVVALGGTMFFIKRNKEEDEIEA